MGHRNGKTFIKTMVKNKMTGKDGELKIPEEMFDALKTSVKVRDENE